MDFKISNEYILALLQLPKVGPKTAKKILSLNEVSLSGSHELFELILEGRNQGIRVPNFQYSDIETAYMKAEKIFDSAYKNKISIISQFDQSYPKRFNSLSDAPLLLYVKGNKNSLQCEKAIAVIGTREPSEFASKAGYRLTQYFTEASFTIVSGLAIGCDTVAHKSCLANSGTTIAVLANGLDSVYPKQNKILVDEILEKEGAVLSEYPPGVKPRNNFFVERDRLQSGLSDAICIIETDIKGGTMHTFKFALQQGRLVSVLSHPEAYRNEKSRGNEFIINEKKGFPLGTPGEIVSFIEKLVTKKNLSSDSIPEQSPGQTENQTQLKLDF